MCICDCMCVYVCMYTCVFIHIYWGWKRASVPKSIGCSPKDPGLAWNTHTIAHNYPMPSSVLYTHAHFKINTYVSFPFFLTHSQLLPFSRFLHQFLALLS